MCEKREYAAPDFVITRERYWPQARKSKYNQVGDLRKVIMERLSQSEIEFITHCLKEGKPLPDSYRYVIPFETKKEYEVTYADKEREDDILADTFAVPLQPVKTFGSNGDGWTNKLIFGDNLQVLKTLMQMKVLDHIIIGDNCYFSFADEGLIEKCDLDFLSIRRNKDV